MGRSVSTSCWNKWAARPNATLIANRWTHTVIRHKFSILMKTILNHQVWSICTVPHQTATLRTVRPIINQWQRLAQQRPQQLAWPNSNSWHRCPLVSLRLHLLHNCRPLHSCNQDSCCPARRVRVLRSTVRPFHRPQTVPTLLFFRQTTRRHPPTAATTAAVAVATPTATAAITLFSRLPDLLAMASLVSWIRQKEIRKINPWDRWLNDRFITRISKKSVCCIKTELRTWFTNLPTWTVARRQQTYLWSMTDRWTIWDKMLPIVLVVCLDLCCAELVQVRPVHSVYHLPLVPTQTMVNRIPCHRWISNALHYHRHVFCGVVHFKRANIRLRLWTAATTTTTVTVVTTAATMKHTTQSKTMATTIVPIIVTSMQQVTLFHLHLPNLDRPMAAVAKFLRWIAKRWPKKTIIPIKMASTISCRWIHLIMGKFCRRFRFFSNHSIWIQSMKSESIREGNRMSKRYGQPFWIVGFRVSDTRD